MPDLVIRICPSCGGKLEFTDDTERVTCAHCGAEHTVRRSGGLVSLAPVSAAPGKVQVGVDNIASELAKVRPERDIQELKTELGRLRLERDIQQLKTELAQLRAQVFEALWMWFICTDIVAYIGAQIDWTCSLPAVILLSLVFLVRMVELRSRRRETQAILERKQSEL
jgi:hypothetical protein